MTTGLRHQSVGPRDVPRHVTSIGLAGIATGILVGGVGGRVFMRIAGATAPSVAQGATTEAGFRVGEVTADGTIGLVVFVGILTGFFAATLFAVVRPWLDWAGHRAGMAFGIVLFAVGSATSDMMNPDNPDFAILRRPLLDVILIGILFLVFGVVMERVWRTIDRRLPPMGSSGLVTGLYVMAGLVGAVVAVAVLRALFLRELCDCDPPIVAGIGVLAMAAATVGLWLGRARRRDELVRWSRHLGRAGLVLAVVFGTIRVVSDALDIIS